MKHGFHMGSALALGLLVACASGADALRDEGSERIEEAMRPELHPEVIPEGIALGDDAPPLALPEPELARVTEADPSCAAGPSCRDFSTPGPWLYGPIPVVPGAPLGPYPGAVRFHIEARPGGSIPGLLP